jgi:hypothetical protein
MLQDLAEGVKKERPRKRKGENKGWEQKKNRNKKVRT